VEDAVRVIELFRRRPPFGADVPAADWAVRVAGDPDDPAHIVQVHQYLANAVAAST
jgi:hypothetical protein